MGDLMGLSVRYGGSSTLLDKRAVRMAILDAICRELREQGYHGSGNNFWHGSEMQRLQNR